MKSPCILAQSISLILRPGLLAVLALSPGDATGAGELELSLPQGAHIIQEVRLHDGTAIKVMQSRSEETPAQVPGSMVSAQLRPGALVNVFAA